MTKGSGLLAGYSNHYDSELRKNKYSGHRREETSREKEVMGFFLFFFPLTSSSNELVSILEIESEHVEAN